MESGYRTNYALFAFAFQNRFLKILNFFSFFFALNYYFLVFLDHFDVLLSKIIFKK